MPTLAIDTATEVLALALGEGESVIAESSIDAGRSHLELLLPAADKMLEDAGMTISDITAIVVGTGPGTFSGLRVGIASARALAQSAEIPLFGACTLDALAKELAAGMVSTPPDWVLPLIDARRGQVFARLYKNEGKKGLKTESEVLCLDPDKLSAVLPDECTSAVRAGGNGAVAYRAILEADDRLALLRDDDQANRIRAIWHLEAQKEAVKHQAGQLLAVLPVYVREPDADKTILLKKRVPWLK